MNRKELFTEVALDLYGEELVDVQYSSVLILYPEIVITNSMYGNTHIIRDLVIQYPVTEDTVGIPRASRLSLLMKEYKARYIHSHVSQSSVNKADNTIFMRGFCTGRSGIRELSIDLDYVKDKENFKQKAEYFLLAIESFAKVESEVGRPFVRVNNLDDLSNSSTTTADTYLYSTNRDRMIEELLKDPKKFFRCVWDGSKFRVSLLREANLISTYSHLSVTLFRHEKLPNGETRKIGQESSVVSELELGGWNFKGRTVCRIIDHENYIIKEHEKETTYFISHYFSRELEKELERRINREYSLYYAGAILDGWKAQTEDYRRSPLTDKTTLS